MLWRLRLRTVRFVRYLIESSTQAIERISLLHENSSYTFIQSPNSNNLPARNNHPPINQFPNRTPLPPRPLPRLLPRRPPRSYRPPPRPPPRPSHIHQRLLLGLWLRQQHRHRIPLLPPRSQKRNHSRHPPLRRRSNPRQDQRPPNPHGARQR